MAAAGDGSEYGNEFNPWIHDWSEFETKADFRIKPQPILADIEFIYRNKKKYMVMGFLDREGLQTGYKNYDTDASDEENDDETFSGCTGGDILIASMNSDGTATLEDNGEIDGDGGESNDEGPGGGEFFYLDRWQNSNGDIYHEEIVQGGTAYLAGSDSVPFISFDPSDGTADSGGINFLKISGGTSSDFKILDWIARLDSLVHQGKSSWTWRFRGY